MKAILFFVGCSEVNSTWLITSEVTNQRARKVLFTCVVYTNLYYYCQALNQQKPLAGMGRLCKPGLPFQLISPVASDNLDVTSQNKNY